MVKCILIDDEEKAMKLLRLELEQFEDKLEVCNCFTNAEDAISYLKFNRADLVFLDMDMPGMSGLEFLQKFPDRNFEVIFTTAHSRYALNAFKHNAIDFLLKPVDVQDLALVIRKVEKVLAERSFGYRLNSALDKLSVLEGTQKKVKFTVDGKILFFEPEEILYIRAKGNYCIVYLENGEQMFLTTQLGILEEALPDAYFYRVHNSYIVNLAKVKSYHKNDALIGLSKGVYVPVSRQKRMEVLGHL